MAGEGVEPRVAAVLDSPVDADAADDTVALTVIGALEDWVSVTVVEGVEPMRSGTLIGP